MRRMAIRERALTILRILPAHTVCSRATDEVDVRVSKWIVSQLDVADFRDGLDQCVCDLGVVFLRDMALDPGHGAWRP